VPLFRCAHSPHPAPTGAHTCRFTTDPSGTSNKYQAAAIGSGAEGATTALQENFRKDLTLAEAELLALSTLKQVMEEKVRITIAYVIMVPLLGKTSLVLLIAARIPDGAAPYRARCLVASVAVTCAARYLVLLHRASAHADIAVAVLLQVTPTNVDISSVAPRYHLYTTEEVEAVIARL
jgi:hypothetical protein